MIRVIKSAVLVMIMCVCAYIFSVPVYAQLKYGSGVGISAILDYTKTEEEYITAADSIDTYGYKHIGIANVENHLNVRKGPSTDAGLAGKMSNNAACEIIAVTGEWAHIVSGDVEGYVHTDYLLMGGKAEVRAYNIVSKVAKSTEGGLRVRSGPNTDSEILTTMAEGEKLEVIEELEGWIKVSLDDEEAYISADYAVVEENLDTAVTMTELLYGQGISDVRIDLCSYAKQFIGNPYVWGGASLTSGTDCSGFTMSVYKKYGITIPHSSVAQSKMGAGVSLSEAKPGDLVFYAKGGTVNHVGIYVGNGQVVHASNPKQGIKISPVGYRTIHSIRRFIKD